MEALDLNDTIFAILVDAAVAGHRCPNADGIDYELERRGFPGRRGGTRIPGLAHAGRIKIEIFSHNWRVIEICEGEHKGKRTQACPRGGLPFTIIDKTGHHTPRRMH